uniref:Uncharacterized protein n=1 Tax=Panagrolaimus sp. ES5 TaxID=591445 RepID=A0AC34FRV6_9BILA
MKPIILFKGGCIILYLLLGALIIGSIASYWRNEHSELEEFDIGGKKVTINPSMAAAAAIVADIKSKLPQLQLLKSEKNDDIQMKYGIVKNCKGFMNDDCKWLLKSDKNDDIQMKYGIVKNCKDFMNDDCKWPENSGFVGDTVIVVMLTGAVVIYVANIIIMLVSIFLRSCPAKVLYFLPLSCFLGTVFSLASIAVFLIYYNEKYFPYSPVLFGIIKGSGAESLYKVKDDTITGPSFFKITYAEGFYVLVVVTLLSLAAIGLTAFTAYKSVNDEEAEARVGCEIQVVKAEVAPASSEAAHDTPPE